MTFRYMIFASLLAFAVGSAVAAPAAVEPFDRSSWAALLASTSQPAIVIFTSVSCTHCPGAIARLAAKRSSINPRVSLIVVSMDSEDDAALLRDMHYAPADRLLSFRGHPQALTYSVNPGWRGMTPYVAFIDGKAGVKFVLGEPKEGVLVPWLRAAR